MVFSIIDAMTDGFSRATERNGLVFVAVFAGLAVLNALVGAAVTVYTIATTARAFDQLRGLEHRVEAEPRAGAAGATA